MRHFSIHGPFSIKKARNGLIDSDSDTLNEFWDKVETAEEGLSSACGCYLFAVKAAHGIKPWYVGMTSKRSFSAECLGNHQRNIYNDVIAGRKGTPLLFFIAKRTKGGKFRKPSRNTLKDISYLETLLIGAGIEKNSKMQNVQKTKFLRETIVPGFLNTPQRRPSEEEQRFTQALFKD